MENSQITLNNLLVKLFNDILRIEEDSLKNSESLSDISLTEMHTIEAIGAKDERTMSEVAADLGITVGTLTTAINKLVKKGYVNRRRIEEDRRVVMVELTSRGKAANRLHQRFHNEMIKETIDVLSEEEERILISSLNKLIDFFHEKHELINSK